MLILYKMPVQSGSIPICLRPYEQVQKCFLHGPLFLLLGTTQTGLPVSSQNIDASRGWFTADSEEPTLDSRRYTFDEMLTLPPLEFGERGVAKRAPQRVARSVPRQLYSARPDGHADTSRANVERAIDRAPLARHSL